MEFKKTPLALATFALFTVAPFAAHAISVSFKEPLAGEVLSNVSYYNSNQCEATGSDIKKVAFSIVSSSGQATALNTELGAPWNCTLNSKNFADGDYTLRAVAYDSANRTATATRSITIKNNTTSTTTTTTNASPVVSIGKPSNGATLPSGLVSCAASASDSDGIQQVQWFLGSTLLNTELSSPYDACNLDTRKFAAGTHVLKAVATDKKGAIGTAQISVTIGSTSTGSTTTSSAPAVTITKPANGTTVSSGSVACAATASDSDGIQQVQWFVGSTLLNTELNSPYDACNLNASNLANGTHTLKAVATDKKGNKGEAQITLTKGTTSTGSTTTSTKPVVTFTAPADGATLPAGSNSWSGGFPCTVTATDTDGIKQVQWYLDNTLLGTELKAPFDSCNLDTTKFSSGAHVLRAVATDNKNEVGEAQTTVNLGGTTSGGTTNTPPTVSLTSPASGATLTGSVAYAASASDTGGSVAKVEMFLVSGGTQKLVDTKTAAPYQGTINSAVVPDGPATLMAVATDNLGATATTQRSVTISNGSTNTDTTTPPPATGGTGTTLPSTNASAVATFESLGVYWKPTSTPSDGACTLRYRKASESSWKEALPMWFDPRNAECRGSIVHLAPGTDYVVEMGLTGKAPDAGVNTKTWSESFPIAKTVQIPSGSGTFNITEGGSPSGYVLYTGPATLDAKDAVDHNVVIAAPYVIVRGLTLKGAKRDAISIRKPAHDVVIEDNDISGWGRWSGNTSVDGWKVAVDGDSAIAGNCWGTDPWLVRTIIQRNKIHHPRYGSNSWSGTVGLSNSHPKGSNAIFLNDCGGNHVWRHNEVYSDWGKYFNDGFGGFENHSARGTPNSDSDIYGNIIRHVWDDAIESEGANMNVRIWGNYLDQTATGIATTSSVKGPVYLFRNVWNRSRHFSAVSLDADGRLYMFKSGSTTAGDGRRYVFHNTMLQAPPPAGSTMPLGGGQGLTGPGGGQNLTNTVSRNNIFHIWKSWWSSISDNGGGMSPNNLDYDLVNGNVTAYPGAEANRIVGTPTYKAGHGWSSDAGGNYQLQPGTNGHDAGARLPNFNDAYNGNGPDMGAHEEGAAPMKLGVQ